MAESVATRMTAEKVVNPVMHAISRYVL